MFEKSHFQNFTMRLSNQTHIIEDSRPYIIYVKTYFSDLEG